MTVYVQDTMAAITLLKTFNMSTTDVGDMLVYRATRHLERDLSAYLTGRKS